jgi:hypothetical protein
MRKTALSSVLAFVVLSACDGTNDPTCCAIDTGENGATPIEAQEKPTAPAPAPPPPEATPNGYGEGWHLTSDWPGEWPYGFSIIGENVVLQGRARLDKAFPADIACPLPQYMNVHQWNDARNEVENWRFQSAEKMTRIEIIEDATIPNDFDGGPDLSVKAGDIGMFKQYHSEGAFTSEWNGKDFIAYLENFEGVAQFEQAPEADLWVNVRCYDGNDTRAWILHSDIQYADGIGPSFLENFGGASDLTAETLAEKIASYKDLGITSGDPTEPRPYDDTQYTITDFWSGEYPSSFAIARADVTLYGYDDLAEAFTPTKACPMPHKAAYHPWNTARNEADQIIYKSVVPKTMITMRADTVINASAGGIDTKLDLKAGETLTYITYLGENWFIAEYDGVEYEFSGDSFTNDIADFPELSEPEEWVNVACTDSTRTWLKYTDIINAYGVRTHGSETYGTASDLP